jgi:hypothetical protein
MSKNWRPPTNGYQCLYFAASGMEVFAVENTRFLAAPTALITFGAALKALNSLGSFGCMPWLA